MPRDKPTTTKAVEPRRQLPSGNGIPLTGGILDLAIDVGSLPVSPLSLLIYGPNRVGKTTLACDFEKPLLLISFEPASSGGAESVRNVPGVKLLTWDDRKDPVSGQVLTQGIKTVVNLQQLADQLAGGAVKYFKTLVIDSATSLQERVLASLMGWNEMPAQLSFGVVDEGKYRERAEQTKELLKKFVRLQVDKIILAKEKDHNPPTEKKLTKAGKIAPDMRAKWLRGINSESCIGPDLGGATAGWLMDACDHICRLYVGEEMIEKTIEGLDGEPLREWESTGRLIRYLRTEYHPNYLAGSRSCKPSTGPEIMEPTAAKIIQMIRG